MQDKILKKVQYIRADGELMPTSERIVRETPLQVIVDGRHFVTSMILAAMEKEYVTGYLYVQGEIKSAANILSIEIKDNIADVRLKEDREKRTISQNIRSGLIVRKEDVFSCVRAILKSPVFKETETVHSAGLFLNGKKAVSITEDLGRHNALDKVIGAGLLKDIDFSRILAASTGRQPAEMILKCRNAGIPIIATKGVPTSMAVELAKKTGITIAGLVRGDTMIVYSHPERVE
ncbi:MAG: formate dehydrogenase accessory protein [Syntrophorhabdus sp. PtaU1.Bin002]|nr:MAG: formate dehydrogenase accessory protein [Syntrophorhabdus sp. PtaB.Bin006]OPY71684.1 MAG: formate dehydrogenase accessory protein [Syntrophorhabdus sp. PtaU1.Bin002]